MAHKILAACGNAAASASTAKSKLEGNLPEHGLPKNDFTVQIVRITELESVVDGADAAVVMSGNVPDINTETPLIKGVNLMTGINEEEVYSSIASELS
jgi:galactitol-specific phosphotransferase system IIB component